MNYSVVKFLGSVSTARGAAQKEMTAVVIPMRSEESLQRGANHHPLRDPSPPSGVQDDSESIRPASHLTVISSPTVMSLVASGSFPEAWQSPS